MKSRVTAFILGLMFFGLAGGAQNIVKDSTNVKSPGENITYYNAKNNTNYTDESNLLSSGIGFGGNYHSGRISAATPNFIISYEKENIFDNANHGSISLGALISYKNVAYDYLNDNVMHVENWNYLVLAFRAAYHFKLTTHPKWDPYAGLMLSYYYINYALLQYTTPNCGYIFNGGTNTHYLAPSAFIGCRYYITEQLGVWAELSYGYTLVALGGSIRF